MNNKAAAIIGGFKKNTNPFSELVKGITSTDRVDDTKLDVFSKKQISDYLGKTIQESIGKPKEIQKAIVSKIKSEMATLVSINLKEGNKEGTFFVAPKGTCVELSKAISPLDKNKGYFTEPSSNEEDIISYIEENNPDDETLIKEFGEGVIDILNDLSDNNKIDVDEDGNYFITNAENSDDENDDENEEGNEESNEDEEENFKNLEQKIIDYITENQTVSEEDLTDNFGDKSIAILNELEEEGEIAKDDEDNYIIANSESSEEENKEDNSADLGLKGEEIDQNFDSEEDKSNFEEEDKLGTDEKEEEIESEEDNSDTEEENNNEDSDQEEDNLDIEEEKESPFGADEPEESTDDEEENLEEENKDTLNNEEKGKYSPEELENFAKNTASKTLIKFYKTSSDEDLKEVAKIELDKRGIDISKYNKGDGIVGDMGEEGGEANTSEEMSELKKWIDEYFTDMDVEDLVQYVSDLALKSPSKRKELKEHYRKSYQMSNGGNNVLKVDEKEFESWLKDQYLPQFSFGDLKDYALKLLAKSPKEIKKMKSSYDDFKNVSL